jgi:hypothetical protein
MAEIRASIRVEKKKITLPLDTSIEHAAALGRLLGHWAYLESQLIDVLQVLLATDDVRAKLTWQQFISAHGKIDLMQRLNVQTIRVAKRRDSLNALLGEAQRLNSERNKFVHALWTIRLSSSPGPRVLMRVLNTQPGNHALIERASEPFTAADIQKVTDEVSALSSKVITWLGAAHDRAHS